MRGTVEAPSDVILGRPQLEPRGLSPEVLELVALPRILGEDVQHGVEVVEDDPAVRSLALGAAGKQVRPPSAAVCTSSTIALAWRSLRAVQIAR